MSEVTGLRHAEYIDGEDLMLVAFIDYRHTTAFLRGDFGA
jgi:hypothetical protein